MENCWVSPMVLKRLWKTILHFSRLAAAPLPLFDPLSRFYGLGTQSLHLALLFPRFFGKTFEVREPQGAMPSRSCVLNWMTLPADRRRGNKKPPDKLTDKCGHFFSYLADVIQMLAVLKASNEAKVVGKTSSCGGSWVRAGPFAGKVANHAGSLRKNATRWSCSYQAQICSRYPRYYNKPFL